MKSKGVFVVTAFAVAASGCLDWEGAWKRAEQKGVAPNPTAASEIKKKIENNVPEWDVYLTRARDGAPGIKAVPHGGKSDEAVLLDPNAVKSGRLSLVDLLAIANRIEQQHYRLEPLGDGSSDGSEGGSHGFGGHHRDDRGREVSPGEGARAPGTQETPLARGIHDALLRYVSERVNPSECRKTCEGSYAACSEAGARAFGGGVPCEIGGESTTAEYVKKYGNSWCGAAFCPAMQNIVEGWK